MRRSSKDASHITQLLHRWRSGCDDALDELLPLVADELRRIAAGQMRTETPSHTLQPTALVNELYLRLTGRERVTWRNRAHFFGTAARMMRRILIDHARAKAARKRGGDAVTVPFDPGLASSRSLPTEDLLALDDALERLRGMDPDQARIVELRFFAGLTIPEVAEVLAVSPATVSRAWASAKAWLYGELRGSEAQDR